MPNLQEGLGALMECQTLQARLVATQMDAGQLKRINEAQERGSFLLGFFVLLMPVAGGSGRLRLLGPELQLVFGV